MQISPKLAIWINIIVALLTLVSSGGLSLAGIVSAATATQIVTVAGTALAMINAVMHAFASSKPGPLAPPDSPSVVAATAVANLKPEDSAIVVRETKDAAISAVQSRNPKAGPA